MKSSRLLPGDEEPTNTCYQAGLSSLNRAMFRVKSPPKVSLQWTRERTFKFERPKGAGANALKLRRAFEKGELWDDLLFIGGLH